MKLSERISPKIVAPAHGLVFKNRPEMMMDYHGKLAMGVAEMGKVTVIYDSMYGSVEMGIPTARGSVTTYKGRLDDALLGHEALSSMS